MSDLSGKTAVVTGASKGIGAAIGKALSAAGAAVVVNYSSTK
jgi:3-oxoacyl-[acyl-carrier protein] reductase